MRLAFVQPLFKNACYCSAVRITSSTKESGAVAAVDGAAVGDGKIGDVWLAAQALFSNHKYDY